MRIKKKNINNLLREIGSFIPVQEDTPTGDEIQTLGGEFSQLSQEELQKMQAENPRVIIEGANAPNLMRQADIPQTFANPQTTQPFFNPSDMRENPNNFGNPAPQFIERPNNFSSPQPVNPLFRPVQLGTATNETNPQPVATPQQMQAQAINQADGQMQAQSTATIQPRTSQTVTNEIDELSQNPAKRESSFFKRLGGGMLDAYINWGKTGGGLENLLGQLAFGGAASGISPGFRGEWQKNQQKDALMRERAQIQQQEDFQNNQDYRKQQTANIDVDNQQRASSQRTIDDKAFNDYTKIYGFDPDKPTPQQKAYLDKYGLSPNQVGRRFPANAKVIERNGTTFERDPNSGEYVQANVPVEKNKELKQFNVSFPDGSTETYWMTDQEAGKQRVALQTSNARIEATNANTEESVKMRNQTNRTRWETSIASQERVVTEKSPVMRQNNERIQQLETKKDSLNAEYEDERKEINSIENEIGRLRTDNARITGEIEAAQKEAKRLKENPPTEESFTPTQTVTAQTTTGNKPYAGLKFQNPAALRSKFPGLTDDQIRQRVTENGGTFIQ